MEKEIMIKKEGLEVETVSRLELLGFKKITDTHKSVMALRQKLVIAYEHYRFVTPEKINKFNEKLKKETMEEDEKAYRFKQLRFTGTENTTLIPPNDVLGKMEEAIERGCFDSFEIADIQSVNEIKIKDPILFGKIEGCVNRFFIAQWDEDVRIEDILLPNEG